MSRSAFIFGLALVALLIVALYRGKYGASEARQELATLDQDIAAARARLSLLETDLAHRIRREWIEEYARRELGMGPPRPDQFVRLEDLGAALADSSAPSAEAGQ
ncbi:MAG: septum formation initiator family protein [Pseudomonadota bacterium]